MSEELQEQTEATFENAEQEATETMAGLSPDLVIEDELTPAEPGKELSPVEKVLLTLTEGLVQIGTLGRDQSNLVIEAGNKIREAIKAIQEDARI